MRVSGKRTICVVLVLCFLSATTSYAKTTQDNINDTKNQIYDIINKKDEAEGKVDDIEGKKNELESDLGSLNNQLSNISSEMNKIETQITDKEAEIEQAQIELEDAQNELQKQYEDMKIRIQYMYENGNMPVWQALLESDSFRDFLNRTEYVAEINQYDREKLIEFQELQQQIAQQKENLEQDKTELLALQENLTKKQASVNALISSTKEEIAQKEKELDAAASSVDELNDELKKMIEFEQQLEIQKAKEDAARLDAIKEEEAEDTSGVVYVPADSDAYLLGAIIQCESEGEPYEGKLAVGSVVLNRVKSSYFPNTISGVIYQNRQFSPVASGRLAYRLEAGVNSACLQAAQEVLNGNITINALYFRTNNGIIQGTVIGNHVFY